MINPISIGKRIAEAIINEAGPCFYPGKFKPPHKGHFEVVQQLFVQAAEPYGGTSQ